MKQESKDLTLMTKEKQKAPPQFRAGQDIHQCGGTGFDDGSSECEILHEFEHHGDRLSPQASDNYYVMYAKAPSTVIQQAKHAHPTVSELIQTMLGDLKPLVGMDFVKRNI